MQEATALFGTMLSASAAAQNKANWNRSLTEKLGFNTHAVSLLDIVGLTEQASFIDSLSQALVPACCSACITVTV